MTNIPSNKNPYLRTTLPPNTIVPENDDLFNPYFNRIYEDTAYAVNSKDSNYFPIPVTDSYTDIPNMQNFGAYLVCISGVQSVVNPLTNVTNWMPTNIGIMCKSDGTAGGVVVSLLAQAGTGDIWAGATLSFNATATNFQVKHSVAGVTGNFNIRIVGTQ